MVKFFEKHKIRISMLKMILLVALCIVLFSTNIIFAPFSYSKEDRSYILGEFKALGFNAYALRDVENILEVPMELSKNVLDSYITVIAFEGFYSSLERKEYGPEAPFVSDIQRLISLADKYDLPITSTTILSSISNLLQRTDWEDESNSSSEQIDLAVQALVLQLGNNYLDSVIKPYIVGVIVMVMKLLLMAGLFALLWDLEFIIKCLFIKRNKLNIYDIKNREISNNLSASQVWEMLHRDTLSYAILNSGKIINSVNVSLNKEMEFYLPLSSRYIPLQVDGGIWVYKEETPKR